MQNYVDFPTCTRHALDYTCEFLKAAISADDKDRLMQAYAVLPAYPDVESGLKKLRELNCRMFAFSNGRYDSVVKLLQNAGIDNYFDGVVSVDDIKVYKPSPAVYSYFMRRSGSASSDSFLVSGNPFDVIGASSAGMGSIWIKRSPDAVFDPWEIQPSIIIETISDIYEVMKNIK
jgi:2-haloacid dehalogenase